MPMPAKTHFEELTLEERDQRMASLKLNGLTYQSIANDFGISLSAVYEGVERAMQSVPYEDADSLRKIELAHLDKAQSKALKVMDSAHYLTDIEGHLIEDADGDYVPDDSVALKAIDSLVKVQARRARLLGLDQPIKVENSGTVNVSISLARETVEAHLKQLELTA
jgi:hypothetical protein